MDNFFLRDGPNEPRTHAPDATFDFRAPEVRLHVGPARKMPEEFPLCGSRFDLERGHTPTPDALRAVHARRDKYAYAQTMLEFICATETGIGVILQVPVITHVDIAIGPDFLDPATLKSREAALRSSLNELPFMQRNPALWRPEASLRKIMPLKGCDMPISAIDGDVAPPPAHVFVLRVEFASDRLRARFAREGAKIWGRSAIGSARIGADSMFTTRTGISSCKVVTVVGPKMVSASQMFSVGVPAPDAAYYAPNAARKTAFHIEILAGRNALRVESAPFNAGHFYVSPWDIETQPARKFILGASGDVEWDLLTVGDPRTNLGCISCITAAVGRGNGRSAPPDISSTICWILRGNLSPEQARAISEHVRDTVDMFWFDTEYDMLVSFAAWRRRLPSLDFATWGGDNFDNDYVKIRCEMLAHERRRIDQAGLADFTAFEPPCLPKFGRCNGITKFRGVKGAFVIADEPTTGAKEYVQLVPVEGSVHPPVPNHATVVEYEDECRRVGFFNMPSLAGYGYIESNPAATTSFLDPSLLMPTQFEIREQRTTDGKVKAVTKAYKTHTKSTDACNWFASSFASKGFTDMKLGTVSKAFLPANQAKVDLSYHALHVIFSLVCDPRLQDERVKERVSAAAYEVLEREGHFNDCTAEAVSDVAVFGVTLAVRYAAMDAVATLGVYNALNIMPQFVAESQSIGLNLGLAGAGQQRIALCDYWRVCGETHAFFPRDDLWPDVDGRAPCVGEPTKVQGARVIPPIPGFYPDSVACFDFQSLYPQLMNRWNLGLSTMVMDPALHNALETRFSATGRVPPFLNRLCADDDDKIPFYVLKASVRPSVMRTILIDALKLRWKFRRESKAAKKRAFEIVAGSGLQCAILSNKGSVDVCSSSFSDAFTVVETNVLSHNAARFPMHDFAAWPVPVSTETFAGGVVVAVSSAGDSIEMSARMCAEVCELMCLSASLDAAQLAQKQKCNSKYGVMKTDLCGMGFSRSIAALITGCGRRALRDVELKVAEFSAGMAERFAALSVAETLGLQIVAGDTDSVYVRLVGGISLSVEQRWTVFSAFSEFADAYFRGGHPKGEEEDPETRCYGGCDVDGCMRPLVLELEKVAQVMLQTGTKKANAQFGHEYAGGPLKISITGLAYVREDRIRAMRALEKRLLDVLLTLPPPDVSLESLMAKKRKLAKATICEFLAEKDAEEWPIDLLTVMQRVGTAKNLARACLDKWNELKMPYPPGIGQYIGIVPVKNGLAVRKGDRVAPAEAFTSGVLPKSRVDMKEVYGNMLAEIEKILEPLSRSPGDMNDMLEELYKRAGVRPTVVQTSVILDFFKPADASFI
jgi:DNA polymerase elongation subunit (family B)